MLGFPQLTTIQLECSGGFFPHSKHHRKSFIIKSMLMYPCIRSGVLLTGARPHQCSQSHWCNFLWLIQDLNIPEANVNASFRMWQTGSGGGFRCTGFRLTCPRRVRKQWKHNVENSRPFQTETPALLARYHGSGTSVRARTWS